MAATNPFMGIRWDRNDTGASILAAWDELLGAWPEEAPFRVVYDLRQMERMPSPWYYEDVVSMFRAARVVEGGRIAVVRPSIPDHRAVATDMASRLADFGLTLGAFETHDEAAAWVGPDTEPEPAIIAPEMAYEVHHGKRWSSATTPKFRIADTVDQIVEHALACTPTSKLSEIEDIVTRIRRAMMG